MMRWNVNRRGLLAVLAVLAVLAGLSLAGEPALAAAYSLPGYSDTAVVTGLAQPTAFAFTPDGRMLILEKAGRVRIVVGGALQASPALDLSAAVDSGSEKGLLGICLDPAFEANGRLFLYYTTLVPKNRISRFTMSGNSISAATETVILDGIDATNGNHDGGTVAIGPDGKLWAAPGDSGTGGAKSQNLAPGSFNGKVLRMELDGSPAAGNPFLGDGTKEPRIFAYGFRNPFRFGFRPSNGAVFVADVGQSTREEIDVVVSGGNYGWPAMEGTLGSCSGCLPPVFEYDHTVGQAIVGGVFVTGNRYPALLGKYVFADEVSSWIRTLDFDGSNTVVGTLQSLASAAENPVCFGMGPDGSLYYAAIGSGKIYRIDGPGATSYHAVPPCRVLDTRLPDGPDGGPALLAGVARAFPVAGRCGVPITARAVAANVAVTRPSTDGSLAAFPPGQANPIAGLVTFRAGQTRSNNTLLSLGPSGDFLAAPEMASGTVHLILDAVGYFE